MDYRVNLAFVFHSTPPRSTVPTPGKLKCNFDFKFKNPLCIWRVQ